MDDAQFRDHEPFARFYLPILQDNALSDFTRLLLDDKYMQDTDMINMAQALRGNTILEEIRIPNNSDITTIGMDALFRALAEEKNTSAVRLLDFRGIPMTSETVHALVHLVQVSSKINEVVGPLTLVDNDATAVDEETAMSLQVSVDHAVALNHLPRDAKKRLLAVERRDPAAQILNLSDSVHDDDVALNRSYTVQGVQTIVGRLATAAHVTRLDISGNCVGDVRGCALAGLLKCCPSLLELRAANNELSDVTGRSFVDGLRVNDTLTELHLADNNICDPVGQEFVRICEVNTTVAYIELSGNCVKPETITLLLRGLMLNGQPQAVRQAVPRLEANDSSLTYLDYHDSSTYNIADSSARALMQALKYNQYVYNLDLSNGNITDDGAEYIATLIRFNKSVKRLVLRNNSITDKGAEMICDAVRGNSVLEEVNLEAQNSMSGNPVSRRILDRIDLLVSLNKQPVQLKHQGHLLLDRDPGVTTIDLRHSKVTRKTIALMSSLIEGNPHVTELYLRGGVGQSDHTSFSHRSRDDEAADEDDIIPLLEHRLPNLTRFEASNLNLSDKCLPLLQKTLQESETLTHLNLADNNISTVEQLIKITRTTNNTLVDVQFNGNPQIPELERSFFEYVVKLNRVNKKFKRLCLQMIDDDPSLTVVSICEIENLGIEGTSHAFAHRYNDDCIALLCMAAKDNTHVTKLDISGNGMTDVGASVLAEMLSYNCTIASLKMEYNYVTDEGMRRICDALASNHTITAVAFGGNKIKETATAKAVNAVVAANAACPQTAYSISHSASGGGKHRLDNVDEFLDNAIFDDAMEDFYRDKEARASPLYGREASVAFWRKKWDGNHGGAAQAAAPPPPAQQQ